MIQEVTHPREPKNPHFQEVAMKSHLVVALALVFITLSAPAGADITVCGSSCPSGYHMTSTACSFTSCSGSCPNQAICATNTGTSFTMCGGPCPSGYYLFSVAC